MNGVLCSLGRMKEALQESLKKQWDMESEQRRKMQALVHDIKTPLTIIKGNAELSEEDLERLREDTRHMEKEIKSCKASEEPKADCGIHKRGGKVSG